MARTNWSDAPFGNLLVLPTDGKPVQSFDDKDEAWADVTKGIRAVINEASMKAEFKGIS